MTQVCTFFAFVLASALVWWPANQPASYAHYLFIPLFFGIWLSRRHQLPSRKRFLLLISFLVLSELAGRAAHFLGIGWHSVLQVRQFPLLITSFFGRWLIAACAYYAIPIRHLQRPPDDHEPPA